MNFLCLFLAGLVGVSLAYRTENAYRKGPQRAVMFAGYYNNPLFRRSYDFVPQGSMSAVVTRDTVATNSYAGPQPPYPPIGPVSVPDTDENETVEQPLQNPVLPLEAEVEAVPQEELSPVATPEELPLSEEVAVAEEVSTEAVVVTRVSNRTPKKQATKKPIKAEEEDDENLPAAWPFSASKGSVPSYTAFFPITISGGDLARRRAGNEDEYFPGSATAIANSFSTGKGGIATSHATSFGDPYLTAMLRNLLSNFKANRPQEV